MSTRTRIEGLRKQVNELTEDQTVMAISRLMDELSAAVAGGHHTNPQSLSQLFEETNAEHHYQGAQE